MMKTKTRQKIKRFWITAATVSVGVLANDCQTMVRDSFTTATRTTIANLLNPSNFNFEGVIRDLLGADDQP